MEPGGGAGGGGGGGGGAATQGERRRGQPRAPSPARPREAPGSRQPNQKPSLPPKPSLRLAGSGENSSRRAARASPGLVILSKPRTAAAAAAGSRGGPGVGVQSGVAARGSGAPPRIPSHTDSSNSDLSDCASEPLSGPEEEDDEDDAGGNSSDDGGGGGGMGPPRGGSHVRGPLPALPVGGRKVPVSTAGCVARGAARGESPQGLVSVETMERQDLMREAEELRSENAYLKDEMEEMKAEMEEMRDSYLEEDVQALQELRRELDRTNKSVRILQYRLRKAERKGMKAAQGGQLDGELVRAMEQDLKVAKDVSVRLHRELESVEERRARLDEENDALRERLVELDTARQALANEVERTRENSLRRRSREPQKADKKSPAQEDSADLRCQLQFAKEEAVLMRRKLARVGKERDRSEGELQRYRALYGELDGQPALGEAGGPPSSRQAELKLRLKLLEEEANILGRKIVELEIENRGLKAELEDARAGVGCGGGGGLAGPPGERDGAAGASQDETVATDVVPPTPRTATSDPDEQQQQQGRGTAPAAGEDRRPHGDPAVREELRAARQQLGELSGAVLRLQQENRLLTTSLQRREEEAAAAAAAAAAVPGGQSRDATIAEMDGDEGRPPRRAREGPIGGESDAATAGGEKPPASVGGAGPGSCGGGGDGAAAATSTATTAASGGGGGGGDGEAAGSEVTCCRLSPGAGLDVLAAYARVAGMRREAERLARTVDRVIGEAERLATPGAVGVVTGAGPGPCREAQLLSAVMRDFRRELRTFATALGGAAGGGGDGAAASSSSSSMWRDDEQTPPSAINQHQEKQQQQQQQQENGVWDSWDQSETDSDATRRDSDSARRHSDTTWRDTDTTRRRTHSDNSGDGVAWAERRQRRPEGRGRDGGGDDSGDDDNDDEGEEEGDHSSRELGARELLLQLKQLLGPRRGTVANGQGPRAQVELSRGDGEGVEDRSDDSPGTEDSGVHSLSESSQAACHALVESLLAELRSRERRTATAHERRTSWETERRRLLSCLAQCECGCASLWPEVGDVVRRDLEEAEEQGSGLRRARSVSSMSEFRRLMESSPFLPTGGMVETPHDPLHGEPPSPSPPPSPPPPLSPDDVRFVREFSSPWGEGCPPRGWREPPEEAGAPGEPRRRRGRGWRASNTEKEEDDEVVGGERQAEEEGEERREVWRGRRNEAPVGPRVDPAGATNLSDDMKRRVASRATARLSSSSSVATQVDGDADGTNGTIVNPGGGPPARHSVSTQTSGSAWAPRRGPATTTPRGSAGSTPAASPSRGALHARPLSTASSASFSSSRADRPSSGTASAAARGLAGASPRSLRRSPGGGGSSGRLDARPGTAGGGAPGVGSLSPWARSTTTRDSPVTRVAGDDRPSSLFSILGFSVATSPPPPPVPPPPPPVPPPVPPPRAAMLTLAVPTAAMAVAATARERSPSPRPGMDGVVPVPPAAAAVKAATARGGGEHRAGARLSVGPQSTELRRSCDSLDAECGAEGNGDAARKGAESGEQERAAGGNEDHSEGCCSSLNPAVPCNTAPVATT
ncbi:uncharacterized protein LOC116951626 isoform X2 [Petromyzon marinus]|uniref:uncharacterized protein LOC116951626 isoform X2 n=1 Tax=Petromyzon marinus TaxID=7757 RepID=UPI003F70B312